MYITKFSLKKEVFNGNKATCECGLVAKFRLYREVAPENRDVIRSRINCLNSIGMSNYLIKIAGFENTRGGDLGHPKFRKRLSDMGKLDVYAQVSKAIFARLGFNLYLGSQSEFGMDEVVDLGDLHNYLLTGETSKNPERS